MFTLFLVKIKRPRGHSYCYALAQDSEQAQELIRENYLPEMEGWSIESATPVKQPVIIPA